MKVTPLDIEGAWLIEAQTHKDNRGLFREWFRSDISENSLLPSFEVIQANTSVSEKGVIRGIHYSDAKNGQSKIVTCTYGSILDSVVDLRTNSKTFGKSVTIELNSENGISIYISSGLGHGFQALESKTAVTYLLNKKYDSNAEYAINPLDKELGIKWRKLPVVISEKDNLAPSFNSLKKAHND
jgi:dTDP-4-dehydrorhamnose 3,5-epimerase